MNLAEGPLSSSYVICPCHWLGSQVVYEESQGQGDVSERQCEYMLPSQAYL